MNIILVTSVCYVNYSKPYTYSNTRSIFTPVERFQQLKDTFRSIKKHLPEYKIVLVEYSPFTKEETEYLEGVCDHVLNLIEYDGMDDIWSIYKGLGERIMLLHGLQYILDSYPNIQNMFKISGRYMFNETFSYKQYDNDHMNFYRVDGDYNNMSTCVYKLKSHHIVSLLKYLQTTHQELIDRFKGSLEQYIAHWVCQNLETVTFIPYIGISGRIGVNGELYKN